MDKGTEYKQLQPVYALSLVNDIFEPDLPDFYHHYKIVHLAHNNKVLKGLEFVFIEIPKFKVSNYSEKKLQALWLRYLSETENDDLSGISPELFEVEEIREAIDLLQESSFTKAEMATYDRYWDSVSVERTLHSELYEGGMIKGMIEGKIKGMIEGKIEGKIEGVEQMIINGYKACISIELLAEMAQISQEEVQKILNK